MVINIVAALIALFCLLPCCHSFHGQLSTHIGSKYVKTHSLYFHKSNNNNGFINNKNSKYTININQNTNTNAEIERITLASKSNDIIPQDLTEDNDMTNNKWFSRILLLIVSIFYGTNFGCVKILDEALDLSVAAVLRFSLAAFIFLPYVSEVIKKKPRFNIYMYIYVYMCIYMYMYKCIYIYICIYIYV
jgi:hypothetical protein